MRAVNLIPAESRRGAGAPSRSNGAVYGVLGVLGVLGVVAILFGLSARTVNQREDELQSLTAQTAEAQARAQQLAPYSKFVKMARDRETTVTAIAGLRFDWGVALREIARVVPEDVDLTALTGSRGGDANASADGAAAAASVPQFQLVGCADSQADVAIFMARLRAIDGVERVRLDTSAKTDGASGAGPVTGEDCREQAGDAQFTAVVFFGAAGEPVTGGTAPAATPGAGAAPSAPASGTQEGAS